MDEQPEVSITYFLADKKKIGGAYITAAGCVKKIEKYERTVVMRDATKIPIDHILKIDSEMFSVLENKE
ncbi:MAG: hypothetical protein AB7E31_12640 [Desulfitobacterium sp.]